MRIIYNGYQSGEELFWSKVDREGPIPSHQPELGRCWLWTGCTNRGKGEYGLFGVAKKDSGGARQKTVQAHRYAYEQTFGPLPDDLQLDHLCEVTICCNPLHLEPVTQAENLYRAWATRTSNLCPLLHEYTTLNNQHRWCETCFNQRRNLLGLIRGLTLVFEQCVISSFPLRRILGRTPGTLKLPHHHALHTL